jgi:tight adherence protein C
MMEFLAGISNAIGISSQTLFIVLTGTTVFFLGFAIVGIIFAANDPVRRRLAAAVGKNESLSVDVSTPKRDFMGMIKPVARYVLPQDGEERTRVANRLTHAGFRSEKALPYFYGIKALLAIGLPLIVFLATSWLPQWTMGTVMIALIFAAFLGVSVPNIVLEKFKESRLKKLRNGFPDALDLLVVCVEAGLGLGAAIARVARDLEVSHAELADELRLVNVEMRAGVERPTALKNLADRSGLADIRGLVGLLVQTMRFGTSIADALRVYSEEFRDKRMQRAEEQAAKIGTKLIFPLVTCLFPAFFIVAVGPAALRMIIVFKAL